MASDIAITFTSEEQELVTLKPKTRSGGDAKVDGVPVWDVDSGDVTVVPAEDGLSCEIVSGGQGVSVVRVTADADLGLGVENLVGLIHVTITAPMAVDLGLLSGGPELKPTVAPPTP